MRATAPRSARRVQVLDRALQIASEEGLDRLTIGRLADDLDLSKSGVFGYFGSKEALQLATLEVGWQQCVADMRRSVAGSAPGESRLRRLMHGDIAFLRRQEFAGGCLLAAATPEYDGRPGPVGDMVRSQVKAWLGGLTEEAVNARVAAPERLALELWGLMLAANSLFQITGAPEVLDQAQQGIEDLLLAHRGNAL